MEKVTHNAQADARGENIGSPDVCPGVIAYALKSLGLCAGMTDAPYKTTTEVYPDSPRATPAQCNAAQVAAVCAAIDYALQHARSGDEPSTVRRGRSGFLAAAVLLVDGGPGNPFGGFLRLAFLFLALLDVRGLAFLLVGIGRFVTLGHDGAPLAGRRAPYRARG
jgi:hypothetical protein